MTVQPSHAGAADAIPATPEPADATAEQVFRLYVSSASPASSRAIVNARRFFERFLPGRHTLTVLDIASHVDSARDHQIVASPTLVRIHPLPLRRFIGDISDPERLRRSLGLMPVSGG